MAIVASGQMTLTDLNDSKQLVMYIGASQSRTVIYNGVSTYTPNYGSSNQVLTPQLFVAGGNTDVSGTVTSTKWYVQTNGAGTPVEITASDTNYTLGTGTPKTLTIKSNVLASNSTMTYICEVVYPDTTTGFSITSKAEIEVVKVTNGTNGVNSVVAVLSNESANVPSDSAGTVSNWGGSATTLTIYNGATDDTAHWTISQALSGVSGTASGTPANRTFTPTGMSADSGTVTFTATRSGYPTMTKVYTINKTKAGQNPTSYWLVASAPAIQKNISGVYTPSSITFSGKAQTGTGAPASYSARFIIAESTDGTNFTDKYTSSANETSKAHTPSAGIKAVRARMYLAGGTSTLLDEQTIAVVSDGATGQDSLYANVWTPDGNTIRNSSGSLKATVDLYKGASQVTPSAFKWYIQDPTATTTAGGDSDGGAGWRLLTSTTNYSITGYTTDTITIPASAIASVESFMCIVTYGSGKYRNVCTVIDVSDPILVRIDGINVFKNGQGTTSLRATLLRNGEEIDADGTGGYTYNWALYNDKNVKTTFTATTKTITVSASDISGRANIVCDVSK
jgi:hypothetical protein